MRIFLSGDVNPTIAAFGCSKLFKYKMQMHLSAINCDNRFIKVTSLDSIPRPIYRRRSCLATPGNNSLLTLNAFLRCQRHPVSQVSKLIREGFCPCGKLLSPVYKCTQQPPKHLWKSILDGVSNQILGAQHKSYVLNLFFNNLILVGALFFCRLPKLNLPSPP
jgi:hypothetical protein